MKGNSIRKDKQIHQFIESGKLGIGKRSEDWEIIIDKEKVLKTFKISEMLEEQN